MAIAARSEYTVAEFASELESTVQTMGQWPIASDLQEQLTDVMYAGIRDNFLASQSAWMEPWKPHAPSTIRRYGPHPLLILTGSLLAAATNSGVEGNYLDVTDRSITIGVTLPYAVAQQFGTDKIPARPFFDLPNDTIERIEDMAAEYFISQVVG